METAHICHYIFKSLGAAFGAEVSKFQEGNYTLMYSDLDKGGHLPESGMDFSTEINFWMSWERNLLSWYALKKIKQ